MTSKPSPAGDDVLGIALKVAAAIESVGGAYFVGGSVASSLQGEPRATNDIDFVIAMPIGRVEAFRDALGTDFEVDLDSLRDAILHARTSNAFYLPSVTKIDFFGRASRTASGEISVRCCASAVTQWMRRISKAGPINSA